MSPKAWSERHRGHKDFVLFGACEAGRLFRASTKRVAGAPSGPTPSPAAPKATKRPARRPRQAAASSVPAPTVFFTARPGEAVHIPAGWMHACLSTAGIVTPGKFGWASEEGRDQAEEERACIAVAKKIAPRHSMEDRGEGITRYHLAGTRCAAPSTSCHAQR